MTQMEERLRMHLTIHSNSLEDEDKDRAINNLQRRLTAELGAH